LRIQVDWILNFEHMKPYLIILFLLGSCYSLQSQDSLPRLYIDCQTRCDTEYILQKVKYVQLVRDRYSTDIFLLATDQSASGGTREIQFIFEGRNEYQNLRDTITFYRQANTSDETDRVQFVKHLKEGLLPYMLQSPVSDLIEYNIDVKDAAKPVIEEPDEWKNWSFNIGFDFSLEAEESFQNTSYSTRFSISNITQEHKFFIFSRYSYDRDKFSLSDGTDVTTTVDRNFNFIQYVKSLSDHWSAGLRANAGSSSFGNTDFEAYVKPAVEYNIFPYRDNSTRRFSFLFAAGPEYKNYSELTVFDKLSEVVYRQSLDIEFEQTQAWGDISFDIEFDQYLHDLSLYSLSFNPNIELNLVKGLRLDIGGYVSWVSDRINIAKSDVTDADILLKTKQLDTNYTYFSYIGFNYRFGSQRSIVNPRF